ncbi:hypothetical protein TNCV_187401 [Trichonephila clavipes]|nr:hypothetical protein TNCV_187401 [Trichonephila clavipes]
MENIWAPLQSQILGPQVGFYKGWQSGLGPSRTLVLPRCGGCGGIRIGSFCKKTSDPDTPVKMHLWGELILSRDKKVLRTSPTCATGHPQEVGEDVARLNPKR